MPHPPVLLLLHNSEPSALLSKPSNALWFMQGEVVSNHDELMCNFFAQADALATGKSPIELRAENVPNSLIPHKTFTGNRPSTSVLLPELTAYTVGQILSLYENRIAVQVGIMAFFGDQVQCCSAEMFAAVCGLFTRKGVMDMQGFIWGINSFDQWGVELGKVLASKVRAEMHTCRTKNRNVSPTDGFNHSTTKLLNRSLLEPFLPNRVIHTPQFCAGATCMASFMVTGFHLPSRIILCWSHVHGKT